MITVHTFVFNFFSVNTYILSDETGECAIIDPGCSSPVEENELETFISRNRLQPVRLLNTHLHVDHILGNVFVSEKYGIETEVHPQGRPFWGTAREFASVFGIRLEKVQTPRHFLNHGDTVSFGNALLHVLYTPGHADGSICLVNHEQKFVIAGDVLFYGSIGRTDLPTGNFERLINSIETQLLTLPDDYTVYPGHGQTTTIGYEKQNNSYFL
ncbi:MAG: MBL fold metallo-hydrolase [Lentimicrobiaceae bacterium]|nr:MBL fold metallo-hydrolase [Lentimicrobiaceae bacterium]